MGSGLIYNLVANWGLGLRALSLVPLNRLIGNSGASFTLFRGSQVTDTSVTQDIPASLAVSPQKSLWTFSLELTPLHCLGWVSITPLLDHYTHLLSMSRSTGDSQQTAVQQGVWRTWRQGGWGALRIPEWVSLLIFPNCVVLKAQGLRIVACSFWVRFVLLAFRLLTRGISCWAKDEALLGLPKTKPRL